jgi:hypothetical protein
MAQRVLVVDVGGTHLKILASGQRTPRKIASGPKMTARLMCNWVKKAASDWQYEVAAIGYPRWPVALFTNIFATVALPPEIKCA